MPIPAEVLLIDSNYVKKFTPVNGSVDDNFIYAAMYIAQDMRVQPYLGDDLMAKLKSDSSGNTLSGNYLTLAQNYVYRSICWWTLVEMLQSLTYKIDNGTIVQRTSEDATPVPDSVMKDVKQKAEGNAKYYTQRMVEYLCANSHLFPEYSSNEYPERCPRTDVYGQFNYAFSGGNTAMNVRTYYENILPKLPLH
jgi:hypothetical protein